MADQGSSGERTEKATPKKRKDARERGQVRKSADLAAALSLIIMVVVVQAAIPDMGSKLMGTLTKFLSGMYTPQETLSMADAQQILSVIVVDFVMVMLIIFGVAIIAGIAANVLQFGFLFSTKSLGFKMGKLNPLKGLKRIISLQTLFDLAKNLVKLIVIGIIIYGEIAANTERFPLMMRTGLHSALGALGDIVFGAMLKIAAVMVGIGVMDYIYQWFKYEKELKMSKYEVKMEYKQQEGDPMVKSRIQQKQRQMAMMRMMQSVPDADVVITNPTHYAVALKYEAEKAPAPRVCAKGKNLIAQRIKELAKENGVEIVEDKPLARGLYAYCEIGDLIPADMYQAVAEILAQIYRKKKGK